MATKSAALFFILVSGLFMACASHNARALQADADEVIIIGRILAYERGVEVSPDIRIIFNEPVGTGYRTLAPKDSGHFVLRLPRGENRITHLEYLGRSITFPREYAVLDLPDSGKIHYVGDIRVLFAFEHMEVTGGATAGLGGVGGMIGVAAGLVITKVARDLRGPSDFLPVTFEVASDPEAARVYLHRTFKFDGRLTQSLLETREGPRVEEEVLDSDDGEGSE